MVERWPLSGSSFQSAFALGSLCLRSGSTPKIGGMVNPKRDEKDLTTLYKVKLQFLPSQNLIYLLVILLIDYFGLYILRLQMLHY